MATDPIESPEAFAVNWCMHPTCSGGDKPDPCCVGLAAAIRARDAAVRREARRMPNGWKTPDFLSTEDDGSLSIEWCFGEQGKPGSWRVSLFWDPCDGLLGVVTRAEGQMSAQDDDGVRLVAYALATGDADD